MTYAEQARARLDSYPDGTPSGEDWWNQCVAGKGYDEAATNWVDRERTLCAVYTDGSSLEFDGQHFVVFAPEKNRAVTRDEVYFANWNGSKWQMFRSS